MIESDSVSFEFDLETLIASNGDKIHTNITLGKFN
jgi:hypothetical protein